MDGRPEITARTIAREYEVKAQEAFGTDHGGPARQSRSWPVWSPDLLTIWMGTPKTAGTTLGEILHRKFRGSDVFNAMQKRPTDSALGVQRVASIRELWNDVPVEKRTSYRFAGGHLPISTRAVLAQPNACFTFLRNPIELAISQYYFLAEVGLIRREETVAPGGLSLGRALDEGAIVRLHNYQTRLLSGIPELDPPFRRFPSKADLEVQEDALHLAKRQIDDMFFVGITELFDESAVILKEIFGWRLEDIVYVRKKVNLNRPPTREITQELRERLAKANQLDLALYEYAKARFSEQASFYRRELHTYLPALRVLNRIAEEVGSPDEAINSSAWALPDASSLGEPGPDFWPRRAAQDVEPAAPSAVLRGPRVASSRRGSALLDLIPGAIAGFGLRVLRRSAPGPIIHLRRDSDAHLEHFGTLADGSLNIHAINTLLGGSEGSLAAWYDQSEAANHAYPRVQRPIYHLSGTLGVPTIRFASPMRLCSSAPLGEATELSIFAALRVSGVGDAKEPVALAYGGGGILVGGGGDTHSVPLGDAPTDFAVCGAVWRQSGPDGIEIYRNGIRVATAAARDSALTAEAAPLTIACLSNRGEHVVTDLVELLIWPRALAGEEIGVVCENMGGAFSAASKAALERGGSGRIPDVTCSGNAGQGKTGQGKTGQGKATVSPQPGPQSLSDSLKKPVTDHRFRAVAHKIDQRNFVAVRDGITVEITPEEKYPRTRLKISTEKGLFEGNLNHAHLALAKILTEYDFQSVLDIGSRVGTHAKVFEFLGKDLTTVEIDPSQSAQVRGDYLTVSLGRQFDLIWCSHVLEHQRNVGAFLDRVFDDLQDGGVFAVTVPFALSPMIIGHPSIFTPMHVIYHLVLAGFDCRSARVKTYDQQISVIVRKQYNGVSRTNIAATHFAHDTNFLSNLRDFFPVEVPPRGHIWGEVESLNW